MKYATDRPCADSEKAARRLTEHAQAFEPIQEGRIYIEKINGPFLFGDKGTPAEYSVGQSWRSRVAGSNCTRAARSYYAKRRRAVRLMLFVFQN